MKRFLVLLLLPFASRAADLASMTDPAFAERWAFADDRAPLLSELAPDSKAWFFHAALLAQQKGDADGARKILRDALRVLQPNQPHSRPQDPDLRELWRRQALLDWNAKDPVLKDRGAVEELFFGSRTSLTPKPAEVRPGQSPAAVDDARILPGGLAGADLVAGPFRPLARRMGNGRCAAWWHIGPKENSDAPGTLDLIAQHYLEKPDDLFQADELERRLTVAQLLELHGRLAGRKNALDRQDVPIKLILRKLAHGADEDPSDPAVRRAELLRILDFAEVLETPRARMNVRAPALLRLLELDRSTGAPLDRKRLAAYLSEVHPSLLPQPEAARRNRERNWRGVSYSGSLQEKDVLSMPTPEEEARIVDELLSDAFAAGARPEEFSDWVELSHLRRLHAEVRLLAGDAPDAAGARGVLSAEEFRAIRDRVELEWARDNPRDFAADAPVALRVSLKNVPRLRVAVYDLDPFNAVTEVGADVPANIDLDGAVPTAERTLDFAGTPAMIRHAETIGLPELARPGLYAVEVSGGGLASRAIVRKGRLRVLDRVGAAGHVFTVLGPDGAPATNAVLRLDGRDFPADERGEIAVPFASDGAPREETAFVRAGRLACAHAFRHEPETYRLRLAALLPSESFVEGGEATMLLRPLATVAGAPVSAAAVLSDPAVELRFRDRDGTETVRRPAVPALREGEDVAVRFVVPARLESVRATFTAAVRPLTREGTETLTASAAVPCNATAGGDAVAQALLLRDGAGHAFELRGRAGEPIADRPAEIRWRHAALETEQSETVQTGPDGVVRFGALPAVRALSVRGAGRSDVPTVGWTLGPDETATLPAALHAAEGETLELFAPGWRDASDGRPDELPFLVSLLEENALGETTTDRIALVRERPDGALLVGPLPAGDYRLFLRALGRGVAIRVTRPFPAAAASDAPDAALAGPVRALAPTGLERPLRVVEATVRDGALRVRVAGATPSTRVHVVARRYAPCEGDAALERAFLDAVAPPAADTVRWAPWSADYVSGRRLGDEARYILDRRSLPHRAGNRLFRPSLLVSPRSTADTSSVETPVDPGDAWEGIDRVAGSRGSRLSSMGGGSVRPSQGQPCFDFLAEGARLAANLRPDADGVLAVPLADLGAHQDLLVIAASDFVCATRRVVLPAPPPVLRDVRLASELPADAPSRMEPLAEALRPGESRALSASTTTRWQAYASLSDAARLLDAVRPDPAAATFEFALRWPSLPPEEKRARYGEFACHELDFFLWCRDRPFFEATVLPALRSKRDPDLVDRFLRGEDLSEWAEPARLGALGAFERCLVALRVPEAAPLVLRAMEEECAAARPDPVREDALFRAALRGLGDRAAVPGGPIVLQGIVASRSVPPQAAAAAPANGARRKPDADFTADAAMVAFEEAPMAEAAFADGAVLQLERRDGLEEARRRDAARRREPERAFFRPLGRTKEWAESGWWGRRRGENAGSGIAANRFWLDVARAAASRAAAGAVQDAPFAVLSARFPEADGSFPERMAALALLDLPLEGAARYVPAGGDGAPPRVEAGAGGVLLFRESAAPADPAQDGDDPLVLLRRFVDPSRPTEVVDGETVERAVSGPFVAGRPYAMRTIVVNPTGRERTVSLLDEIPCGAVALTGGPATLARTVRLKPWGTERFERRFYFPEAADAPRGVRPACAVERGRAAGVAPAAGCAVAAGPTPPDPESWEAIARDADDARVVEFLRSHDPREAGLDLSLAEWRLLRPESCGAFLDGALAALDSHLVWNERWWRASFLLGDARRAGEALRRSGALARNGVGPWLRSPVLDVDPEEDGFLELLEYWPLENPRVHPFGASRVPENRSFAAQWRRFLDTLAYKPAPDARDRLLAAVYLHAMGRREEAEAQAALVRPQDVETRMQLDYLRAWTAWGNLDPAAARAAAAPWAGRPVPEPWRGRFAALLAACDEAEGRASAARATAADEAAGAAAPAAPTLRLAADGAGRALLSGAGTGSCRLRAYPVDLELIFSNNPFSASGVPNRAAIVRPAWTGSATVPADGTAAPVVLPEELLGRAGAWVLEASAGEAVARLTVPSREPDVQLAPGDGTLRVRDAKGRPLPAAYVKVYARPSGGGAPRFWKDGYTDPLGAFDYADVSGSDLPPVEAFALLVLHDEAGAKTLETPAPAALRQRP